MKNDFRVLSTRLLDRLLEVDSSKSRVKSGISPPAQFETLLPARGNPDPKNSAHVSRLAQIKKENVILWYLIQFMLASASRVSEALNITPSRITQTGHVKIIAGKGSQNRIVHAGLSVDYFLLCKANSIKPFDGWSRFYVYRQFKRYGIGLHLPGRSNKAVTHSIRHAVAMANVKESFNLTDTQSQLGHKSTRSTKYYHESEPKRK